MKIVERGILAESEPGTHRAVTTFPALAVLAGGGLLATCRAGSGKDGADECPELFRWDGKARRWSAPSRPWTAPTVDGVRGSLKICYLTETAPGRLLAAGMWVDRQTYPGGGLFNPETEGCLPMAVVLAESDDVGRTWSTWRVVPMPEEIGPPSLTSPVFCLADGTLGMSIESNKHYDDGSRWYQKVVLFHSRDGGLTWGDPVVAGEDPSGRIFNWDQRVGVAPDGRIAAFLWTYDSEANKYLNVHRRLSADGGLTWSRAQDLGFADQAAHPAILPDGRVVLAWVDRYGTHSIRARLARSVDADFDSGSEVVLYTHGSSASQDSPEDETGELLSEMSLWSFGLPFAETLPDGSVMVVYYAGDAESMSCYWARLDPDA